MADTTTSQAETKEENHALEQAKMQYQSIIELVTALHTGNEESQEEAREKITEDPLEVSIRAGQWVASKEDLCPDEYRILLCTGGPAVQITGDLNEHSEPDSAHIEYQDWGTPWTKYSPTDENILLEYARCFYFGA